MHSKVSKTKPRPNSKLAFEAIGTHWSIEVFEPAGIRPGVVKAIRELVETFDKNYSRFRADSLVTGMSEQAGTYTLPADAKPLFDLYKELYEISDGAVTPLIGQTLADAGYNASYSLVSKPLQQPPHWEAVLDYDFPNLTVHEPALLDLGGAGKGYLVDLVAELLERHGYPEYCVDAGGDMLLRSSTKTLAVGLEHPADAEQAIGVVQLHNKSLCGSAGNRRKWGSYHHIINPKTLQSPQDILAVWVVADTALLADGLTTALFFVSPDILHKRYTFSYALVRSDFSLEYSADFPAEIFKEP